jgi:GntR family transcriptional regulator, vanillate catabolism transcriptional regulator
MPMSQHRDRSVTTASLTVRALLALRGLILNGELPPGARISEQWIVDRIGASRTPVRTALVRLEEEGFLEPIPSGGFAVRSFTERDIFDAIEVRGTMEGLGARFAAERVLRHSELDALASATADIDRLLMDSANGELTQDHFARYAELNTRFHEALRDLSGSPTISRQIDRANAYPFAAYSALVLAQSRLPEARTVLTVGQDQHRCILEAIAAGQGARAEALTREHARLAARNLRYALRDRRTAALIPGATLIAGQAR